MGADVIQISAVSQRVLSDDVNVTPVKLRIPPILRVYKTFTKNKVGGAKPAGIRSSKKDGVAFHLRVDIKWRCEHVVPVPVAKEMTALLVVRPVVQGRAHWKQGKDCQKAGEDSVVFFKIRIQCKHGGNQAGGHNQGQSHYCCRPDDWKVRLLKDLVSIVAFP